MSHSLPAGDVLSEAFQFAMRRWGTVVRYLWLPVLSSIFLGFLYLQTIFDFSAIAAARNSGITEMEPYLQVSTGFAYVLGFVVAVACLFLYAGFATSLYRLVAMGEERPGLVQFRTDGPAVRTFWALLIENALTFFILIFSIFLSASFSLHSVGDVFNALVIFFLKGAFEIFTGAPNSASPETMEATIVAMNVIAGGVFIALLPLLYLNVRLTPFASGSAVEDRILLFGAFQLTAGRFWSVLLVLVLMFSAVMALSIVVSLASTILEQLASVFSLIGGGAAIIGFVATLMAAAVTIGFQVFATAVQLSVRAIVYRRLKTGE